MNEEIEEAGAAKALKHYVPLYIAHLAQIAMLRAGKPLHSSEVRDAIASEINISTEYLRQQLRLSNLFVFSKHRWELHWRFGASYSSIEGVLSEALASLGYPASLSDLSLWLSQAGKGNIEQVVEIVRGLLATRTHVFWEVSEGKFGLRSWLPDLSSYNEDDVIADNFFGEEDRVKQLLQRVDEMSLDWSLPLSEVCKKAIDGLGQALSHHEIVLTCWRGRNREQSGEEILRELFSSAGLHVISPGYWCTDSLIEQMRQIASEEDRYASKFMQEVLSDPDKAMKRAYAIIKRSKVRPLPITSEDWDELVAWMRTRDEPAQIHVMLSEALEIDPTHEAYYPTLYEVHERLSKDVRFVRLGNHKWWLKEKIPEWVNVIPEELVPVPPSAPSAQGLQAVEVELPDEALEPDLLKWVYEPKYEDVGEPASVSSIPKSKRSTLIPLPYHHIASGTMKLRQIDRWLFHGDEKLQHYIAVDENGNEFAVWVNMEKGIMFGFKGWYEARGIGAGAVVRVEVMRNSDRIMVSWDGKYDSHLHMPTGRMQQLLNYSRQEVVMRASILELMQSLIMPFYEGGMHFIRLWAEVNLLRRTSKRLIASNLSIYACFGKHPEREGYWVYDYERSSEGIRREKRKLVERLLKQSSEGQDNKLSWRRS
ncbi:MAG: hypothetical protein RMK18_01020 [Armatimonadota bacterium]|nr:hypothetical protein [Armatimonadota bacterium]MCX7776877.1 hypothetical protein [Armatimonadota bacterium]MDW8024437.1 hypothetical protein [Armatimonadota bacterium]